MMPAGKVSRIDLTAPLWTKKPPPSWPKLPPGPVRGREILDSRQDLDRRHAGRLQVGRPAEGRAGKAPERVVRKSARATAHREETAELGVHEREQDDDDRAEDPAEDRRRPGEDDGAEGAEQPARADDRPLR